MSTITEPHEISLTPPNTQVGVNAEAFTKAYLAQALFDLLDGNSFAGDIMDNTGLDRARAEEISGIFRVLAKNV